MALEELAPFHEIARPQHELARHVPRARPLVAGDRDLAQVHFIALADLERHGRVEFLEMSAVGHRGGEVALVLEVRAQRLAVVADLEFVVRLAGAGAHRFLEPVARKFGVRLEAHRADDRRFPFGDEDADAGLTVVLVEVGLALHGGAKVSEAPVVERDGAHIGVEELTPEAGRAERTE